MRTRDFVANACKMHRVVAGHAFFMVERVARNGRPKNPRQLLPTMAAFGDCAEAAKVAEQRMNATKRQCPELGPVRLIKLVEVTL